MTDLDEGREHTRRSDVKITVPLLGTVEASGATVVTVLLVVLLIGTVAWHHIEQDRATDRSEAAQVEVLNKFAEAQDRLSGQQERTTKVIAVFTCVLTLTEAQRREFRIEGRYCGDWEVNRDIKEAVKPEGKK